MAAGDLITLDHQYEYNGLLIGSRTQYLTEVWDGMFDLMPDLTSNDLDRNDRDGTAPGLDRTSGRTITATVHLLAQEGTQTVWALAKAFAQAYRHRPVSEAPFCFRHPMTNGDIWMINCRPRKLSMPKDSTLTMGHGQASIQLYASRPEFLKRATSTASLSQPDGTATTTAVVTNNGNYNYGPKLTLSGAWPAGTTLTVSGQTTFDTRDYNGSVVTFPKALLATDTLVVDFRAGTIMLNGVTKNSYVSSSSPFIELLSGATTLTLTRPSSSGAVTANLEYRDAWMV